MVMAARPTQMPVLAGGGEEFLTWRRSPPPGTRSRQPPLPESRLAKRSKSIFGGSWTVVAISSSLRHGVESMPFQSLFLFGRVLELLRRSLHDVVSACALDAVLIRIVINHRHGVA